MAQTSSRPGCSWSTQTTGALKDQGTTHGCNHGSLNHFCPNDMNGYISDQPMTLPQDFSFEGYHDNDPDNWDRALQSFEAGGFDPSCKDDYISIDFGSASPQGWSNDRNQETRYPINYDPFSTLPTPNPLGAASLPSSLAQLGSFASSRGYMGPLSTTSTLSDSITTFEFSDSRPNESWYYPPSEDSAQYLWSYSPATSIKEETDSLTGDVVEHITSSPRPRGRHGKLTNEKRSKAAMMRRLGSCDTCKKRKSSCDEHTPCASCISYYGQKLPENPCRGQFVITVRELLLNTRIKWHASPDFLGHSQGRQIFTINETVRDLPISFGDDPPMNVDVHIINSPDHSVFRHPHVAGSDHSNLNQSSHRQDEVILPATIPDPSSLDFSINEHFDKLVCKFPGLPSVHCTLNLLAPIFNLYQYFLSTPTKGHGQVLHDALKLLLIIQIGREVKVPSPTVDPKVNRIFQRANLSPPSNDGPITPCFLRADLGRRMPNFANMLMTRCLKQLEHLQLGKRCEDFPLVLALMIVMSKVIEAIQMHGTQDGFHDNFSSDTFHDDKHAQEMRAERDNSGNLARINGDRAFEMLLRMHCITFRNCHNRLQRFDPKNPYASYSIKGSSGRSRSNSAGSALANDTQSQFVHQISFEIFKNKQYLEARANYEPEKGVGPDFANRLVSRVLLLR